MNGKIIGHCQRSKAWCDIIRTKSDCSAKFRWNNDKGGIIQSAPIKTKPLPVQSYKCVTVNKCNLIDAIIKYILRNNIAGPVKLIYFRITGISVFMPPI